MTLPTQAKVVEELERVFAALLLEKPDKAVRAGEVHHWKTGDFVKSKKGYWLPVPKGGKSTGASGGSSYLAPSVAPHQAVGNLVKSAQQAVAVMFPDVPGLPGAKALKAAQKLPRVQRQTDGGAQQAKEKAPKPEESKHYDPDPTKDANGDGVADAARVGVPGMDAPPPGGVPRLPHLNETERAVESKFADTYEHNADSMASDFYSVAAKNSFVFETDGAKALMPEWTRPDLPPDEKGKPLHPERAEARALYNTALHQTANAVAKKAFLKRLDEVAEMPEEKRKVLVTSGGVAGGKGSALAARPDLPASVAATWDAAGEQNATENPWVLEECQKRGIKPVFLFVSADPKTTWPGAVERAKSIGRMVDARVFADSYAQGAKNFAAFHDKHKHDATFVFARAKKGEPATFTDGMDPEALKIDANDLYKHASEYIDSKKDELPPYIYAGATAGRRIWGK